MLAGLSQGYLYLSEQLVSKAQTSTIDAVNAVFAAFVMAYSLVIIGEDTLEVGVSLFIVGQAVVTVGMGAPVVVTVGGTAVAGRLVTNEVVFPGIVVVGIVKDKVVVVCAVVGSSLTGTFAVGAVVVRVVVGSVDVVVAAHFYFFLSSKFSSA